MADRARPRLSIFSGWLATAKHVARGECAVSLRMTQGQSEATAGVLLALSTLGLTASSGEASSVSASKESGIPQSIVCLRKGGRPDWLYLGVLFCTLPADLSFFSFLLFSSFDLLGASHFLR